MLDWLKRKPTPVPAEPLTEPEDQKASAENRVERLLDRLEHGKAEHGKVEHGRVEYGRLAHGIGLQVSTAEPVAAIEPPPPGEARPGHAPTGLDPDFYTDVLPLFEKAFADTDAKPEDDVRTIAAKVVGSLRDGYGVTSDRLEEMKPHLEQFVKDLRERAGLRPADEEKAGETSTGSGEPPPDLLMLTEIAPAPTGVAGPLVDEPAPAAPPLSEAAALGALSPPDAAVELPAEPAAPPPAESLPPETDDDSGAADAAPMAEALPEAPPLPRVRGRAARAPAATPSNAAAPLPTGDAKTPAERTGGFSGMRVIAVASQKGGSGKTTIAAHLAVRAGLAGHGPVVLIDTDPQGSLAEWWHARSDDTPAMATVKPENLAANLAELRSYGTAVAIIDTPPALTGSIEQVIAMADLIIIPARPSPHDLRAAGGTVAMARAAGKPFMFVVNGASPRASITAQAVAALSEHGRVAPVILYQRTEYAASMIDGRTVMETAASGRSAQEVAELWRCVYAQIEMRVAA